jgi:hypothetical protein
MTSVLEKQPIPPDMIMEKNVIDFVAYHLGVTLSLEHKHTVDKQGNSSFEEERQEGRITLDLLGHNV